MRLFPFTCIRPTSAAAPALVTLPYEDLDLAGAGERARHAEGVDWPLGADATGEREAALLQARLESGQLVVDDEPHLYAYRIEPRDGRPMTGVVAACSVDEYLDGTIRRHEQTRAAIEHTRAAHIEALGLQTGPVLLAHEDDAAVAQAVALATACEPLTSLVDGLGARNTVWRVDDAGAARALAEAFDGLGCAYIVDGHHRAAASADVALERRRELGHAGRADAFLAAIFPLRDFTLLSCNRVVRGALRPRGVAGVLGLLESRGLPATTLARAPEGIEAGHAALFARGTWYDLELPVPAGAGALETLDSTRLQRGVLGSAFGISDPRRDPKLAFVGGIYGLDGLERACGWDDVALALRPPTPDEVMAVADAGLTMPPKSTWFEPKPRGGLFARRV